LESALILDARTRKSLWDAVVSTIETYLLTVDTLPVSPPFDLAAVRSIATSYTFEQPLMAELAFRQVAAQLLQHQLHTPHPQYFGLFNPTPSSMGIAADAFVAALNPQLAAWSHSPLAVEMEQHLLGSIAERLGFSREDAGGSFTSGGAEANQTALLSALLFRWPEFAAAGLRGLKRNPVLYISAEGHHSFLKAARCSGLGIEALREIQVGADLRMDPAHLVKAIRRDRIAGNEPFMIVATAGTTGAGVIDPLAQMASIANEYGLWLHVDAAWGGGAALVPELRSVLDGIELADSVTFDAHKWLSVPMGAGMFFTRHPDVLSRAFSAQTAYMPKEGDRLGAIDPYSHSLQWSRRFIGLKLFLSLVVAGWDGYAAAIRHQTAMGVLLRKKLVEARWKVVNETPLPLVCFIDDRATWNSAECQRIADTVVASGKVWISTILLGAEKRAALRACITNCRTEPCHIDGLIAVLEKARHTDGARAP
jgi:glutamate/tyrosine decarboxylase-like PLP-dependent enzyme